MKTFYFWYVFYVFVSPCIANFHCICHCCVLSNFIATAVKLIAPQGQVKVLNYIEFNWKRSNLNLNVPCYHMNLDLHGLIWHKHMLLAGSTCSLECFLQQTLTLSLFPPSDRARHTVWFLHWFSPYESASVSEDFLYIII